MRRMKGRSRMMGIACFLAWGTGLLSLGLLHSGCQRAEQGAYVCPMHPSVTSDKPGNCPVCKMQLVPK